MGKDGFENILKEREEVFSYLKEQVTVLGEKYGERLLEVTGNPISCALSLSSFSSSVPTDSLASLSLEEKDTEKEKEKQSEAEREKDQGRDPSQITFLGSMIFSRNVSGPRVVARHTSKEIEGTRFEGYGAHSNNYHEDYLTFACAVGMKREDVDILIERVQKAMDKMNKTG